MFENGKTVYILLESGYRPIEAVVLDSLIDKYGECYTVEVYDSATDDVAELETYEVYGSIEEAQIAAEEKYADSCFEAKYRAGYSYACGVYD